MTEQSRPERDWEEIHPRDRAMVAALDEIETQPGWEPESIAWGRFGFHGSGQAVNGANIMVGRASEESEPVVVWYREYDPDAAAVTDSKGNALTVEETAEWLGTTQESTAANIASLRQALAQGVIADNLETGRKALEVSDERSLHPGHPKSGEVMDRAVTSVQVARGWSREDLHWARWALEDTPEMEKGSGSIALARKVPGQGPDPETAVRIWYHHHHGRDRPAVTDLRNNPLSESDITNRLGVNPRTAAAHVGRLRAGLRSEVEHEAAQASTSTDTPALRRGPSVESTDTQTAIDQKQLAAGPADMHDLSGMER